MPDKTKTVATMSRRVDYDDFSGPRCEVSYDSSYQLGKEKDRYVEIKAVGSESVHVNLSDVDFLIDALREATRLDGMVND
jgi:hypothetical protein